MGPNSGSGLVYVGTITATGAVASVSVTGQVAFLSYETKLFGTTASVAVDIQVSNVPGEGEDRQFLSPFPNGAAGIPTTRDDSFNSTDWVTVSTNVMPAAVGSRMDVIAYVPHRVSRVRLYAVPTATANPVAGVVYYRSQGW